MNVSNLDENSYDDVALVKFDRPLKKNEWNWDSSTKNAIYPICLPDIEYTPVGKYSRYHGTIFFDKIKYFSTVCQQKHLIRNFAGFVTGFGLELQDTCRTNSKGPGIYLQCAPGTYYRGVSWHLNLLWSII